MAIYKLKTDWNGQTHKDVETYIKQCFLRFISSECIILPNDLDGKSIKDNTGELSFVMYDNIQEAHNIVFDVECTNVRRAPAGEGSWVAPTSSSVADAVDVTPIDEYSTTAIYKLYNVAIDQSKLRTSDHKNNSGVYDQTEVGANFGYVAAVKVTPIIEIEENRFSIEKKPMFFELKGNPIADQQLIVVSANNTATADTDITTMTLRLNECVIIDVSKGITGTTLDFDTLPNFDFSASAIYGNTITETIPQETDPNVEAPSVDDYERYSFAYGAPSTAPAGEVDVDDENAYFYDTITYKAWWGNGSASNPKLVKTFLVKILNQDINAVTEETGTGTEVTPEPNGEEVTDAPAVDTGGDGNEDPTEVPPEDAP